MAGSATDGRVLLVEDDADAREVYTRALERAGYEVVAVGSAAEANKALSERSFPAAILDIFLPDGRGLSLIDAVRKRDPQAVIIVITGFASLDTALTALRLGAYEYLCKPFSTDEMVRALGRGLERRELVLANLRLAEQLMAMAEHLHSRGPAVRGQMRATLDSLATLAEASQIAAGQADPALALEVICRAAARLARADMAAVVAMRDGVVQVVAAHDETGSLSAGGTMPLSPLLQRVFETGKPILLSDTLLGEGLTDSTLAEAGFATAIALPIALHGVVVGVLLCGRQHSDPFAEEKTSLLSIVAVQAAPVLDHWLSRPASGPEGTGRGFIEIDRLL